MLGSNVQGYRFGTDVRGCPQLQLQRSARLPRVAEQTDMMEVLKGKGYRMTPQRRAIVAEVMRSQGHISPAAIARTIQQRMPGVNASTVYRTISMLEDVGILSHAHLEGGPEYHLADEPEHVHLVCANCSTTDDLSMKEAKSLYDLVRKHKGFAADLTHFAVSGLCGKCQ